MRSTASHSVQKVHGKAFVQWSQHVPIVHGKPFMGGDGIMEVHGEPFLRTKRVQKVHGKPLIHFNLIVSSMLRFRIRLEKNRISKMCLKNGFNIRLTWHKDDDERKKTKINPNGFMVFRWPLGDSKDLERPSLFITRPKLTFKRRRGARNPVES